MDTDAKLKAAGAAARAASDGLEALKAFEPRSSGGSEAKVALLKEAEVALQRANAEYDAALAEVETAEMRRLAGLPESLVELLP